MPDRTARADVVVVGCGPGGAVLAYLLARSGVRVALLERAATFEREYRGFGWNPGVVRLFDEMGVLGDVREFAHERVTEGSFDVFGERVTLLEFDRLATDYGYALLMEQPALLSYLVEEARAYDGFSFHPSTAVTDVRNDESGTVRGVVARDRAAGEDVAFDARCVVGADGRYSTVRSSVGVDPGLFDSPIDLVWFKLPAGAVDARTQGRIARDGVLVYFGLGGGEVQVGYPIRAGEWTAIRSAGFRPFRNRIAAVDPRIGSAIDDHLSGFRDVTLLDVAPGVADAWTRDGLCLVGDAAHTASPIGAQGNPLAVEDAVVTHGLLVEALRDDESVLPRTSLREFESRRRPTVERVVSLQRRGADAIAGWLEYGRHVPSWAGRGVAKAADRAIPRSRRFRRAVESFALGDRSVSVTRSAFVDAE